jgi:pyruvate formate lyase activating enzyme
MGVKNHSFLFFFNEKDKNDKIIVMKEAYLYKKMKGGKVKCQNCAHYCVIDKERRGICGVKENRNGKLYALNYGKAIALNIDPIEKKPLFHFLPGTKTFSLATVGCNFKCSSCQNYDISQGASNLKTIPGKDLSPEEIIEIVKERNLPSISYTYTEPTIFSEYALDIMKLAKKNNIKNVWVSNGFLSKELLELISPYLDAINIDLKSFSDDFYKEYCKARINPVLETIKRIKKKEIWLEITTLVIPTLNDSEKEIKSIAKFIKKNLGENTPWHITRFSGLMSWKLQELPETSIETIKRSWEIGKKEGLKYVYTGNIPGLPSEDTFCPKCNQLVIDRNGYQIHRYDNKGKCPKCDYNLNLTVS